MTLQYLEEPTKIRHFAGEYNISLSVDNTLTKIKYHLHSNYKNLIMHLQRIECEQEVENDPPGQVLKCGR